MTDDEWIQQVSRQFCKRVGAGGTLARATHRSCDPEGRCSGAYAGASVLR
jgi:hypothetical protein